MSDIMTGDSGAELETRNDMNQAEFDREIARLERKYDNITAQKQVVHNKISVLHDYRILPEIAKSLTKLKRDLARLQEKQATCDEQLRHMNTLARIFGGTE